MLEETVSKAVIGVFYRVYNRLGYGFLESVYVNALVLELERDGLAVKREVPVAVDYDGVTIGSYRTDLLVNGKLIIEVKAGDAINSGPERQLLNYLKCSDIEVGILLFFGLKPRFKRLIHTRDRKNISNE